MCQQQLKEQTKYRTLCDLYCPTDGSHIPEGQEVSVSGIRQSLIIWRGPKVNELVRAFAIYDSPPGTTWDFTGALEEIVEDTETTRVKAKIAEVEQELATLRGSINAS